MRGVEESVMCGLHAGRACLSSTVLGKDWAPYAAQILFSNFDFSSGSLQGCVLITMDTKPTDKFLLAVPASSFL